MKKWILVLALAISSSSLGFAEEMQEMGNEPPPQNQMEQSMQNPGMMGGPGGGQGRGHKMMGMGMMQRDTLIATSDGGIVLQSGPRLIKYDKDLNLVKEVEIPRGKKPAPAEVKKDAGETDTPAETV